MQTGVIDDLLIVTSAIAEASDVGVGVGGDVDVDVAR